MVVEINNDSSHIYSSDTIISEYTNRPIDENAEEVIGPEFWCVTCHVKLRTAHTAIQHVGGKPHKKKVVAKDTEIKAVNENFKRKLPSNNNNNDPEECVLAKRQKAIDATPDKNLKCEDCNLEFINTVMAIQHFKGKKHANVIARKMEAEKTAILKKWQDPRPVCKGFDSRRGRGNGGASRGGVSRGGARGSARGGTRGGLRGGTRGGTRGGSRGDTRGGNRGGIQPSVNGTFSSGSRGGNRGGNWETGMGSRRGSNRGSGRGGSWGDVNRASTNSHEDSGIGGIRGSGRSFQRGRGSNLDILRNGGNNHINQGMDMNKRPEGESVTGQLRQAMHKLYGDNSYHKSSFSGVYDNAQHDAARNNRFNVDYGLKNNFSSSVGHHPKEHFDLDSYQTQSLTLRSKSQHRDMFINDISDSHEYSRYSRPMDMRLEIGSASHPYLSQWR